MEMSYSVVDLSNFKSVKSKNEGLPMVLASVSKLYSSFYILRTNEPKETFKTKILRSQNSKIENKALKGDLIIQADGDPYLTAQNFIDLIYQIKSHGINRLEGDFLIYSGNLWSTSRLSPIGLEDQADNSSMGGLNFEFNRFRVDRKSHKPIPAMDYLKVVPKKINNPGLKFQLSDQSDKEVWIKNLNEKHKFREELPARNSTLFSAHFFRYLAKRHGLILPRPKIVSEMVKGKLIASHESLPLYRLVELGLEYSNNILTEMLFQKNKSANPKELAALMLTWYQKNKSKKVSWDHVHFENASGLTLDNISTSKNLSQVLAEIYHDKSLKRNFISYLSINDHSGGVRRRLRSTQDSFKVFAKTGSLHFVNNLAGYFVGDSGKIYAFSIFTTDTKKRAILNRPNSKNVNHIRREHKSWHQKSTREIDQLLSSFIRKL